MHHVRALLAAALLAAAPPAIAGTIVENFAFSNGVNAEPVFVTGPLFTPVQGTLTGVSATLRGQYDADIFVPANWGLGPSITLVLSDLFLSDGSVSSRVLGDFTALTKGGGTYLGETTFDFTQTIFSIGAYVQGTPEATNYLAALAFGAVPQPPAGLGAPDDFSTWSGDMTLTYTYDPAAPVPEPACATVFALASLALASGRRMIAHPASRANAT
jgi:hypothetical protein